MESDVTRQNPDGTWSLAEPLPMMGWKAKLENKARRRGWNRVAGFFAAWDERGL